MSAKKTTPESTKTTTQTPTRFSDYTESWVGNAPSDIDPAIEDTSADKVDLTDLLDREVTFHGFVKKAGQTGDFMVMCATTEGHDSPFVVVSGASVIIKKLERVAEANGLPVAGKIVLRKGKKYKYFDVE